MIESGSHVAGINAADFHLPPHTALRYERPAAALADHLLSYAVFDSELGRNGTTYRLPGWAQLWIVITSGQISVNIRSCRTPLPSAGLYGVTSKALRVESNCGPSIAVDVSPLGWARLFSARADTLRDSMVPLERAMDPALVAELQEAVHASDHALDVKHVLDGFFLRHMAVPHPDEPRIAQLMRLLADPATLDLADAAAAIGIPIAALRRLSRRYFGFPPKTLLMRARFLTAFTAMMAEGGMPDYGRIPASYHDVPHFLRDAQHFLGMTPRQFMAIDMPYLYAALRARRLVFGAPNSALDRTDRGADHVAA